MGVDMEILFLVWILLFFFVLGGSCGLECVGVEVVGG